MSRYLFRPKYNISDQTYNNERISYAQLKTIEILGTRKLNTYCVRFDLSDDIVYDFIVSSWDIAILKISIWTFYQNLLSYRIQFDFRIFQEFLMLNNEDEWQKDVNLKFRLELQHR